MNIQDCNYFSNLIDHLTSQNYIGFSKKDCPIQELFITDDPSQGVLNPDEIVNKIFIAAFSLLEDRENTGEALHLLCHALASYSSHLDPGPAKKTLLSYSLVVERSLLRARNKVAHHIFRPGQACCSPLDVNKLILFHQQILQTKNQESELYNIYPNFALESIIDDLTQYYTQISKHPRLPSLIEDLRFTLSIRNQYLEFLKYKDKFLEESNAIAKRLYDQVQLMSQKGGPSSVIIAGGCLDHTVDYQIEKKENGYTFTTFNTGFRAFKMPGTISYVGMPQYDQLPLEKFSEEFFQQLVRSKLDNDMIKISDAIHGHLFCKELTNFIFVHAQKRQAGNSCVTKALMALLHYNLGKKEVVSFKTWLTEVKTKWLQSIESKLQPDFYQREHGFAQEALARRKVKLLPGLPKSVLRNIKDRVGSFVQQHRMITLLIGLVVCIGITKLGWSCFTMRSMGR